MPFPALTDYLDRLSACGLISVNLRELQRGAAWVEKRKDAGRVLFDVDD